MSSVLSNEPEVCNVLGDSITLRITKEQTDGKYSIAEFATPEGVGQPPHTHGWDETYLVLEENSISTWTVSQRSLRPENLNK